MVEENGALQPVKRFALTKVGQRSVSLYGYRIDLVEDHLKSHLGRKASKKWCDPSCLAKTMFGRSTETNRDGIRKRTHNAFRALLKRGLFLVIEYGDGRAHGKIQAFKLFERAEGVEIQNAAEQLKRMMQRKLINEETLLQAREIIGLEE